MFSLPLRSRCGSDTLSDRRPPGRATLQPIPMHAGGRAHLRRANPESWRTMRSRRTKTLTVDAGQSSQDLASKTRCPTGATAPMRVRPTATLTQAHQWHGTDHKPIERASKKPRANQSGGAKTRGMIARVVSPHCQVSARPWRPTTSRALAFRLTYLIWPHFGPFRSFARMPAERAPCDSAWGLPSRRAG